MNSINWTRMSLKVDFIQERDIKLGEWTQSDKKLTYNIKCM